jgi:hypothetical protein
MIEFFERETNVKFTAVPGFADYHPDAPGGVSGGRSIVALPYDGRLLGKHIRSATAIERDYLRGHDV